MSKYEAIRDKIVRDGYMSRGRIKMKINEDNLCRRAICADGTKTKWHGDTFFAFCLKSQRKTGATFGTEKEVYTDCLACAAGRRIAEGQMILPDNIEPA